MLCDQIKRGSFSLHPKGNAGISKGCVTIDNGMDWQQIKSILKSSTKFSVPNSDLKAYGKLIVR